AALIVATIAVPRTAEVARAANIVQSSFTYRGDAARALAALLDLPPDHKATGTYELSQNWEHSALPARDAALRDPKGFLPWELGWRTSTMIRNTASWDPRGATLELTGYVADVTTAIPHGEGPRWSFTSPMFSKDEAPPGWRALVAKLAPRPAAKLSAIVDRRS